MFYIFGRKVQRCISCRFGEISSTFLGFENSLKLKGVLAFIWALSLIGKYAIVSSKVLFSSKVIFGLKPTIFCVEPGERRSDAICFGFVAVNPGTNSRLTKRNIVRRFLARTTSRLTLYKISLRRNFVTMKSLRIIVEISANYRFKSDGNPCEISWRYRRNIARTKRDIQRLSFALLFHNTVSKICSFMGSQCKSRRTGKMCGRILVSITPDGHTHFFLTRCNIEITLSGNPC